MNNQFLFFTVLITVNLSAQVQNPDRYDERWKTDTTYHNAALSEFKALLPRDYFPVIYFPTFVDKAEGTKVYLAKEPVIALEIEGFARAYPLKVLTYHEMANDRISSHEFLVTYCPLCNSGVVFNRKLKINGKEEVAEFGVSGMLRKSGMVMWDNITESWWQQLTGEAHVGTQTGNQLDFYPSQIISVEEFFQTYPEGEILSNTMEQSLGDSTYAINPYKNYDDIATQTTRFIDWELDDRLPAMERILDVTPDGKKHKVYPFSILQKQKVINDRFEEMSIVIFYSSGALSVLDKTEISEAKDIGMATAFSPIIDGKKHTFISHENNFKDTETQSTWTVTGECIEGSLKGKNLFKLVHGNHFAFAFLTFYPDTEIYDDLSK